MNIHQKFEPNVAETALAAAFTALDAATPNDSLSAIRQAAMARFQAQGLPHRHIEAWHYTDLRRKLGQTAIAAAKSGPVDLSSNAAHQAFAGLKPSRLVFSGGKVVENLSDLDGLGEGVEFRALSAGPLPDWAVTEIESRKPKGNNAIVDLSTAMMTDGALIHVKAGVTPLRPLEIVVISEPGAQVLRHVVVVEKGANLRLIESTTSSAAPSGADNANPLSISTISFNVAENARVDHVKVQAEARNATHLAPMMAEVGRQATFNTFTLTHGGELAREERHVRFVGDDTRGSISGAFLLGGQIHADTTLEVVHEGVGGESSEVFKGIINDRAKSVVQTSVTVAPDAQKTDARQGIHALLLSDEAEHNTKPELTIYADDVQCAHGATIGELDETALFYLMSRGISRKVSEALLIEAFVAGALEEIADEELAQAVSQLASAALSKGASHG